MAYEPTELEQKVVIKVFWSWRRVGVSRGWREALKDKEREHADNEGGESTAFANRTRGRAGKGKGWWKKDDPYDDRAGCVVQ
jgi:F-box/leucine-rich repeat protein 2/20